MQVGRSCGRHAGRSARVWHRTSSAAVSAATPGATADAAYRGARSGVVDIALYAFTTVDRSARREAISATCAPVPPMATPIGLPPRVAFHQASHHELSVPAVLLRTGGGRGRPPGVTRTPAGVISRSHPRLEGRPGRPTAPRRPRRAAPIHTLIATPTHCGDLRPDSPGRLLSAAGRGASETTGCGPSPRASSQPGSVEATMLRRICGPTSRTAPTVEPASTDSQNATCARHPAAPRSQPRLRSRCSDGRWSLPRSPHRSGSTTEHESTDMSCRRVSVEGDRGAPGEPAVLEESLPKVLHVILPIHRASSSIGRAADF